MEVININIKYVDNYSVCEDSISKFTQTGHISSIITMSRKNNSCPIKKINKDEYVLVNTGEVFECSHTDNRAENYFTVKKSVDKLRDIINNNFIGGSNELWITLTFGKNKVYNPNDLCPIFEKFIKRLRYHFRNLKLDYLYVPEPHEKGDWHIHLLLKADKPLYIENSNLNEIWGFGFVKVNRLKDIDNIGAYVSAYLTNIKDGEKTKKGARLHLYPVGHQLYRYSKGIIKPINNFIPYKEAKNNVSSDQLTYKKTIKIITDDGFTNTITYEYYNSKRKDSQV